MAPLVFRNTVVLFWTIVSCLVLEFSVGKAWEADDLPGWMGDSYRGGKSGGVHAGGKSLLRGPDPIIIDPTKVIQLSWKPRAFLYKGFLSSEECDHLVGLAKPKLQQSMVADTVSGKALTSEIRTSWGMFITAKARDKVERSMVVDNDSGEGVLSEIRTSAGMFLDKYQDEVVKRVEERIAAWTFLPKENGEAIQVLRYNHGQKYDAHFDFFHDKTNIQLGGHRIATVLMYLSDVEHGGETVFPSSQDTSEKDDTWSECGKSGVAVKPAKGDALLFFSLHPDASTDEMSLHTGCPVLKGEKWSATKWIHVSNFEQPTRDPTSCTNDDPRCEEWAIAGECSKNVPYMVGEGDYGGACRKACKACSTASNV